MVLEIAHDLGTLECIDPEFENILHATEELPQPEVVCPNMQEAEEIASLLASAAHPLIVAGRGAKTAGAQVIDSANILRADVATSAPAQGLFNSNGEFRNLGICGGFASSAAAAEIQKADVVLVVGAGLNPFTMAFDQAFSADATIIQIGVTAQATHTRVNHFLRASATEAVSALSATLRKQNFTPTPRAFANPNPKKHDKGNPLAPDGCLDPRSLMDAINNIVPANRLVVTDGGHFIGWAN
ncbi:MAG: thiamine pyrophosphate-binding protein, partial [Corynebacterium casei]|nr:thiamine pyrophosphate-binding protein [Corynebacterium casei]